MPSSMHRLHPRGPRGRAGRSVPPPGGGGEEARAPARERDYSVASAHVSAHVRDVRRVRGVDGGHNREMRLLEESAQFLANQHASTPHSGVNRRNTAQARPKPATASISTFMPGIARPLTSTSVLAGRASPKNAWRAVLMRAR